MTVQYEVMTEQYKVMTGSHRSTGFASSRLDLLKDIVCHPRCVAIDEIRFIRLKLHLKGEKTTNTVFKIYSQLCDIYTLGQSGNDFQQFTVYNWYTIVIKRNSLSVSQSVLVFSRHCSPLRGFHRARPGSLGQRGELSGGSSRSIIRFHIKHCRISYYTLKDIESIDQHVKTLPLVRTFCLLFPNFHFFANSSLQHRAALSWNVENFLKNEQRIFLAQVLIRHWRAN